MTSLYQYHKIKSKKVIQLEKDHDIIMVELTSLISFAKGLS